MNTIHFIYSKKGTKNSYKQSFRTNFQSSEMFKNYLHVFSSHLEVLFQANEQ